MHGRRKIVQGFGVPLFSHSAHSVWDFFVVISLQRDIGHGVHSTRGSITDKEKALFNWLSTILFDAEKHG
jgi:hypothetical protein